MRLPHSILKSIFFIFDREQELFAALGASLSEEERAEIKRISAIGLPPITSEDALSTMIGVNPGLIWSLVNRTQNHYTSFAIKKGRGERQINAPRVALKIVQKWLSYHLMSVYVPPIHVYGFVPNKSHIEAASIHCGAEWVYSFDISNFFPSTPSHLLYEKLQMLGYGSEGAKIISSICTLDGFLAQGAPSSPVLSNIVFQETDSKLHSVANRYNIKISRYADDITFSGKGSPPQALRQEMEEIFSGDPWSLAQEKIEFCMLPNRLKVHGLLVHQDKVKLTKGYRNRIRGFRHMLDSGRVRGEDIKRLEGHLQYEQQVKKFQAKND